MDYCAGIDVSLELSSVCILDACGQIIREAKVASEPEALAAFLASLNLPLTRVGLEAGPLSQWLHAGLVQAGFEVVLLETRHVKASLSAMISRPTGAMLAVSPSCCAWVGSGPSTASRRRRKKYGPCSWPASSCRRRCGLSNSACAVCCAASA